MAIERKKVPTKLKKQLVAEAGGKCANPGCANYRTHLHHIKEWAIYATNDAAHMIAVCPSCHDAVHNGVLRVDDDTLYRWKGIRRDARRRDQIFVEPGPFPKLLLGSIAFTGDSGVVVFDLSPKNRLGFRLADGDVCLVNLSLSNNAGVEVLRVVENHLRVTSDQRVEFTRRPGRIRITAPVDDDFIDLAWLRKFRERMPDYGTDGRITMLDLEVLEPGLVRVQGLWLEGHRGALITDSEIVLISGNVVLPMMGAGASSVLHFTGPITSAIFGL